MCPRGLSGPPAVTFAVVDIQKKKYTNLYTPFKSDLIHNIDHMRILGTKTSSVILRGKRVESREGVSAHPCLAIRIRHEYTRHNRQPCITTV